jgi:hypothetical protein
VTGSTVPVRIAVRNLTINCAWAGKAPRAGMGHWHLLLDGGLVNMECATAAVLSMQNVAPGKHTITALLAADDHTAIKGPDTSATTTLTYKPAHSLPTIKPYKASGKPRITILAPRRRPSPSWPAKRASTRWSAPCLGMKQPACGTCSW